MAKKLSNKKKVAVGAGVAALAATAAGVYLLSGKRGAKNRKKVSTWAKIAQKDVLKELGKVGSQSQKAYNDAVSTVAKRYKNLKKLDQSEILQMMSELKGHWNSIAKQLNKPVGKAKKTPTKKRSRR